jgi:hypothetical protein
MFAPPVFYLKSLSLKYSELSFSFLFCIDVQLGLSHKSIFIECAGKPHVGPTREELIWGCWKLCNDVLNDLKGLLHVHSMAVVVSGSETKAPSISDVTKVNSDFKCICCKHLQ